MENDSINNENESSAMPQEAISDTRKMIIINLMFIKKQGATLTKNRDDLKSFPMITEEEKVFIDKIYTILQELNVGEDILSRGDIGQLKEELYERCQIPKEVIEEAKQARKEKAQELQADIAKKYEKWAEQDAETQRKCEMRGSLSGQEPSIQVIEGGYREDDEKPVKYKEGLYQPGFLCGHAEEMPEKPFVKHIRYMPERVANISPEVPYQFANLTYEIKKIGELIYMSTPNLKDSLSEYEITISKEGMSRTAKRFGEISFHKMTDPAYSTVVFLQLLNGENLTDKELHGYMGRVEQVQDKDGKMKEEYQVVHLPEEYTAVAIWEEIEREKRRQEQSKIKPNGGRAVGGSER